jgi:hypothetical protein
LRHRHGIRRTEIGSDTDLVLDRPLSRWAGLTSQHGPLFVCKKHFGLRQRVIAHRLSSR